MPDTPPVQRAPVVHAYLHGFGASPASPMGEALREAFASRGVQLLLPDLNQPSLRALSLRAVWAHLETLDASLGHPRWKLVGSSLGGWMSARMAREWGRVDRAVLLAAPNELRALWERVVPEAARVAWKEKGSILLPDGRGKLQRIGYGFYEDVVAMGSEPGGPLPCPTLFAHGTRDVLVPLESSRLQAEQAQGELWTLDDDHDFSRSIPEVIERAIAFLELP